MLVLLEALDTERIMVPVSAADGFA